MHAKVIRNQREQSEASLHDGISIVRFTSSFLRMSHRSNNVKFAKSDPPHGVHQKLSASFSGR